MPTCKECNTLTWSNEFGEEYCNCIGTNGLLPPRRPVTVEPNVISLEPIQEELKKQFEKKQVASFSYKIKLPEAKMADAIHEGAVENEFDKFIATTREVIKDMVKALVNNERNVSVNAWNNSRRVVFTISVDAKDVYMVMGKDGKSLSAIRNIVKARCVKMNYKFELDVEEW